MEDILSYPNDLNTKILETLINFSIDNWKFSRLFERALVKLDAGESTRFLSQYRYFMNRFAELLKNEGINLVSIEGQLYDPGVAATPINISDFEPEDILEVSQMIEPIIMGKDGILKTGSILLKKVTI